MPDHCPKCGCVTLRPHPTDPNHWRCTGCAIRSPGYPIPRPELVASPPARDEEPVAERPAVPPPTITAPQVAEEAETSVPTHVEATNAELVEVEPPAATPRRVGNRFVVGNSGGPGRPSRYTREQLLDAIRAYAAEHGEPPRMNSWDRDRPAGSATKNIYRQRFGTWNTAIAAAGLPIREWSRSQPSRAMLNGGPTATTAASPSKPVDGGSPAVEVETPPPTPADWTRIVESFNRVADALERIADRELTHD